MQVLLHCSIFLPVCDQSYFFHEGKCVLDCPRGYFASEQQQECVRCHTDCASCDGPRFDDCNECRNRKAVRYNGECLAGCPNSTYYDKTSSECRGKEHKERKFGRIHLNIVPLFTVCLDVSQTVTSRVWPAQAMNPPPASPVTLTGVKMPKGTACGLTRALRTRTRTRMGNAKSVTKLVIAVLGQAAIIASVATNLIFCSVSCYSNTTTSEKYSSSLTGKREMKLLIKCYFCACVHQMTHVYWRVLRDTTARTRIDVCVSAVTSAVSLVLAVTACSASPVELDSSSRERAVSKYVQTG